MYHNSGAQRLEAEEATRALPRTNQRPNLHARTTNLLHRIGEHKPRKPSSDEERRQSHEGNPRQDDHGGRRYYHVRPHPLPSAPLPNLDQKPNPLTKLRGTREQLREQHELTQEIGNAITSMPITEPIDEDELEADLAAMEQENLDEKMLKTGTVPVADSLNRLPKAANGECKFDPLPLHSSSRFGRCSTNIALVMWADWKKGAKRHVGLILTHHSL